MKYIVDRNNNIHFYRSEEELRAILADLRKEVDA